MSVVLGFLVFLYVIGVVVWWPTSWFRKTDKSHAPLTRRLVALGHGLVWPVTLVRWFAGSSQRSSDRESVVGAESRILGSDEGGNAATTSVPSAPAVSNPFDD